MDLNMVLKRTILLRNGWINNPNTPMVNIALKKPVKTDD
jgi:hypothetical protein